MTINDYTDGLTIGGTTTVSSGSVTSGYVDFGNTYWPWGTIPYNPTYVYATPQWCSDDCHVFGCEHATACKCGKATRKVTPKKCGACGK